MILKIDYSKKVIEISGDIDMAQLNEIVKIHEGFSVISEQGVKEYIPYPITQPLYPLNPIWIEPFKPYIYTQNM